MSEKSTSVQIRILDKEYHINCPPSDQEALMKSARYLDESMRKVKERGNIHGSEKVAVMADQQNRVRIGPKVGLKPQGPFKVEVIGGLVQQQEVRF